jgi:DNA-binding FrmR family transcriptional regulator
MLRATCARIASPKWFPNEPGPLGIQINIFEVLKAKLGGGTIGRMHTHPSHSDIIDRLKAAKTSLEDIIQMMEHDARCADLAQRLHLFEKAINGAKKILIHEHLALCLGETARGAGGASNDAVGEYKRMTKLLQEKN